MITLGVCEVGGFERELKCEIGWRESAPETWERSEVCGGARPTAEGGNRPLEGLLSPIKDRVGVTVSWTMTCAYHASSGPVLDFPQRHQNCIRKAIVLGAMTVAGVISRPRYTRPGGPRISRAHSSESVVGLYPHSF